jgi:2-oxoglutarate ferredoxin oxidoreductase subunit gamma
MLQDKIIVSGAGGQGALLVGKIIAYAAMDQGWEVEWFPSYGAEMRGGTANCSVTISDSPISFPIVTSPDYLFVMDDFSLQHFELCVPPEGYLVIDSSIITNKPTRNDLHTYYVPALKIAEEEGNKRGANMVLLGVYAALTDKIYIESIYSVIEKSFTGSKEKYAASNKRLVEKGFDFIKQISPDKEVKKEYEKKC